MSSLRSRFAQVSADTPNSEIEAALDEDPSDPERQWAQSISKKLKCDGKVRIDESDKEGNTWLLPGQDFTAHEKLSVLAGQIERSANLLISPDGGLQLWLPSRLARYTSRFAYVTFFLFLLFFFFLGALYLWNIRYARPLGEAWREVWRAIKIFQNQKTIG